MSDKEALSTLIEGKTIQEIILIRDEYETTSEEWEYLNRKKADLMEEQEPRTKENIIYFFEKDLVKIPEGVSKPEKLPNLKYRVNRRSVLEYCQEQRHPIACAIVKYKKEYFFKLREDGSGNDGFSRKIELWEGHVGQKDIMISSLNKTILQGLKRELLEEAGINDGMVTSIKLKGLIKLNEEAHKDHLGVVYEVVINTRMMEALKKGEIKGVWIPETELMNHYDRFELWSQLVYDNILKAT